MSTPTLRPVEDTAERAYVGTLMWLPLDQLPPVLAVVRDDDVSDPRLRAVLALARAVVAAGSRPDPVTLAARWSDDNGAAGLQGFMDTVADLYSSPPLPGFNARNYAAATLTAALRRALRDLGCLTQYADTEPLPALLTEYQNRTDRVSDLQQRLATLTTNQTMRKDSRHERTA